LISRLYRVFLSVLRFELAGISKAKIFWNWDFALQCDFAGSCVARAADVIAISHNHPEPYGRIGCRCRDVALQDDVLCIAMMSLFEPEGRCESLI